MQLFREEVYEHRKTRLHGDVILSQSLSTRVLVGVLFAIIAIAGTWISTGTYSRIETVPGIVVTDNPTAKIVATQSGVVTRLPVIEGQFVGIGDQLAVVDLDRRAAAGEPVAGRSLEALEERQRLARTQLGLSSRRTAAAAAGFTAVLASAQEQAESLREQISLQEQIVASNENLFNQITEVVERGFVSRVEFERRRQTLISSKQQLAGLRQQLSAHLADAVQARAQLAGLSAEAAQGDSEIQSGLQSMAQQQAQMEGEQGYVLTAPISGRVTALQTAVGRTTNPNVPLMVIVPEGSSLKAELYAPTRAVGFVRPGQETRILYDAFPYQRFGSFGGKVQSVSRIVIDPRETEVPLKLDEAFYRVIVALDGEEVEAYGHKISLQPGMTLKANIVLERQNFLQWFMQPLNAVLKRAT